MDANCWPSEACSLKCLLICSKSGIRKTFYLTENNLVARAAIAQ